MYFVVGVKTHYYKMLTFIKGGMGHLQIINNVNQKKKKHNYQNTFTCLNFLFFKYFTQCFELCLKGKKNNKRPKGIRKYD